MKIKNTLIKTLLVFGFSFAAFIGKSLTPEKAILNEAERTIQSAFSSRNFSPGEEKVEILFTTAENGIVNFVLAKTNDAALKKEIEKQFYTMNFPLFNTGCVNSVTLSFKTK